MPALINRTFVEGQIVDHHEVELQNKLQRATAAYNLIDTYNWNGLGVMPSSITWTSPTSKAFRFTAGTGELEYDSTAYSSLTPAQKREFFQYLPKFITECLKAYDDAYNL